MGVVCRKSRGQAALGPSWLVSWELELEQTKRRTRGKLRQGPELRLERVQAMRNPEGNAWNCCRPWPMGRASS